MSKLVFFSVYLQFSFFFLFSFSSHAYTPRLIFIGVDGLSSAAFKDDLNIPNINNLIKRGSSTLQARAILPSSSAANWAAMLMGAAPGQTGVLSNNWDTLFPTP